MLATALSFSSAYADDLSLHGFLQGNYSFDTDTSNPDGGDFKWAEERGQIKLDGSSEPFRIFIKTDVFYDHIEEKGDGELREGYLDLIKEKWDLRAGRQIITWGLGDLIFINDIFPKDYEAFFSGRPMEYLKKGVDGVKFGFYPNFASFELVIIPFFEPNRFPGLNRFWSFDPMPGVTNREKKEPAANLKNAELALRAYRDIAGFDASIYVYRGFFKTPSLLPDSLSSPTRITLFYPELSVYGISLQRSALNGVLSLEAGHYDSREDRKGVNPLIPNSQTKFLIGYQRQFFEDFTVGLQYLGEYMHDYPEYKKNLISGFPKEPGYRQLAGFRITYFLMHQNLRLSWFSFYGLTDKDYLLNPEARYNFSDHIWGALGADIFGGKKDTTQFGSLDKNDNIYVQIRYEF
ncbi:MAG: hypothetical protein Q7T24_02805 [Deltaproteobacteria bacterium]|nr:hypothetical protein [Deltaproteobacteria bacterium]